MAHLARGSSDGPFELLDASLELLLVGALCSVLLGLGHGVGEVCEACTATRGMFFFYFYFFFLFLATLALHTHSNDEGGGEASRGEEAVEGEANGEATDGHEAT